MNLIDLTGKRFGKLTVIERTQNDLSYGSKWLCRCDCGNTVVVLSNNLRRGNTRSCGCLKLDLQTKHGKWGSKVYKAWDNMRERCVSSAPRYEKYYGARGISVCDEWMESFDAFYEYVSALPHFGENGRSLDRINNDGNYEPGNVRWATASEQMRNRRKHVL